MIPHKDECIEILLEMLNIPLDSADGVFEKFSTLPNAKYIKGKNKQERFLYIPGKRSDRVLLVAHADTFWDEAYGNDKVNQSIVNDWPILKGENNSIGIGADNRAGCAMLYALKNSGHSILIMDSEENNKVSHNFLKKNYPQYLKEFNNHSYMLEIDLPNFGYCSSARIANKQEFVEFIKQGLFLKTNPVMEKLGTDVTVLCKNICGINISCGYYDQHKGNETLNGEQWCTTLYYLNNFLKKPQKKFGVSYFKKMTCFIKAKFNRLLNILKRITGHK